MTILLQRDLPRLSRGVCWLLFAEGFDVQACAWCIRVLLVAPLVSCIFAVFSFFLPFFFFFFGLDVLFAPAFLVSVLVALEYKAGKILFR